MEGRAPVSVTLAPDVLLGWADFATFTTLPCFAFSAAFRAAQEEDRLYRREYP
jgi:hypothetical protein